VDDATEEEKRESPDYGDLERSWMQHGSVGRQRFGGRGRRLSSISVAFERYDAFLQPLEFSLEEAAGQRVRSDIVIAEQEPEML
jgi:hypothetical protein